MGLSVLHLALWKNAMILSADWHLRWTAPRARIDDYLATQEHKVRFILEQAEASPPLLVAGDFFHQPKPGESLLRWIIDILDDYDVRPIVVPGQHDLPGHSLDRISESGLGVLAAANLITILTSSSWNWLWNGYDVYGAAYGENPPTPLDNKKPISILLWHHMVIDKPLWPGQEADKVIPILNRYPKFDLIVTGDNHQSFYHRLPSKEESTDYQYLVNPGSMMRMTAAQVDHIPTIYKWEDGNVEGILIPFKGVAEVLDLSELEATKDKDERIQAFVERLNKEWEAGLSFEKNLEQFFQKNETDQEVKELVWRCME